MSDIQCQWISSFDEELQLYRLTCRHCGIVARSPNPPERTYSHCRAPWAGRKDSRAMRVIERVHDACTRWLAGDVMAAGLAKIGIIGIRSQSFPASPPPNGGCSGCQKRRRILNEWQITVVRYWCFAAARLVLWFQSKMDRISR